MQQKHCTLVIALEGTCELGRNRKLKMELYALIAIVHDMDIDNKINRDCMVNKNDFDINI